jgi:hypothetical protein
MENEVDGARRDFVVSATSVCDCERERERVCVCECVYIVVLRIQCVVIQLTKFIFSIFGLV